MFHVPQNFQERMNWDSARYILFNCFSYGNLYATKVAVMEQSRDLCGAHGASRFSINATINFLFHQLLFCRNTWPHDVRSYTEWNRECTARIYDSNKHHLSWSPCSNANIQNTRTSLIVHTWFLFVLSPSLTSAFIVSPHVTDRDFVGLYVSYYIIFLRYIYHLRRRRRPRRDRRCCCLRALQTHTHVLYVDRLKP